MNLTVFLISLAAGGIVIGALCGMLLPRASSGNVPNCGHQHAWAGGGGDYGSGDCGGGDSGGGGGGDGC